MNIYITQTYYPNSCNYSLFYWLDGNTTKVKSKHENSTFEMELTGILYVRLENKLIGSGKVCLAFTTTSKATEYLVDVTCEKLNTKTETITFIPTSSTSPTTTSTSTASTSITSTSTTSTSTTSPLKTSDVSRTVDSISNIETDEKTDDDGDKLLCCIIGILVIILVIIITCISLRKRNCQKNRDSENLNHGSTNMAVYSSLDDNLNDSSQYGHIVRQQEHVPEQQEQVPDS
ncbi:hypothetical protein LOTGIDRAFT_176405, partial [Lottia gigantea]